MVVDKVVCERWCVTKLCVKDSGWQSCMWKMVCDKVVCERWWLTKLYVKVGVWQSCVWKMVVDKAVCERWCDKVVCERWCVTKLCVKDGGWQSLCVKDAVWQMVVDKVVCGRWCVTKLCVKDGGWQSCVKGGGRRREEEEEAPGIQNQKQEPHTKLCGMTRKRRRRRRRRRRSNHANSGDRADVTEVKTAVLAMRGNKPNHLVLPLLPGLHQSVKRQEWFSKTIPEFMMGSVGPWGVVLFLWSWGIGKAPDSTGVLGRISRRKKDFPLRAWTMSGWCVSNPECVKLMISYESISIPKYQRWLRLRSNIKLVKLDVFFVCQQHTHTEFVTSFDPQVSWQDRHKVVPQFVS